jgi:hypothetical protein
MLRLLTPKRRDILGQFFFFWQFADGYLVLQTPKFDSHSLRSFAFGLFAAPLLSIGPI